MTDLLNQASDWLEDQRTTHLARSVVYERGLDQVSLQASIGRTVFDVVDNSGIVERVESRDFLLLSADLVLSGLATEPERGDRIRETVGAKVHVYEVMAPGQEPHYRYSDPYRKTLRVHTKLIDIGL